MIDDSELGPIRSKPALKDLAPLGIAELKTYIADLEVEIARAQAAIDQKTNHRAGIEGLFKK